MLRFVVVFSLVSFLGFAALVPEPFAQLTRRCPAGDGSVLAAAPLGNRSVDIDLSGAVDLADFARFGAGYTSPPKPYILCLDYEGNGIVNLPDFAFFGSHFGHAGAGFGVCN